MELESKQRAVAQLISGEAVDDSDRVAVCIKGHVNGWPAQLDAFMVAWPFGCTYIVQSRIVDDPQQQHDLGGAKVTILPRLGQGLFSIFAHIFLFESKGMSVNDKRLEKKLIFSYDDKDTIMRIVKYPGIPEILMALEEDCKLKEMVIKTDGGVCFSQAVSFQDLDLDLCNATFNYLGQITQVMSEIF